MTTDGGNRWTETVVYSFCPSYGCPDGASPTSGLVLDGTGNLYGTAYFGGNSGLGTVFEVTP